jgi:hypothetical protein
MKVGRVDGFCDGILLGTNDGCFDVDCIVGEFVGLNVGAIVGLIVGSADGMVGVKDGQ